MGNCRSFYRGVEKSTLEREGKVVRCKRIGKVVYPEVDSRKKRKLTTLMTKMLRAIGFIG